jgi:hypothetical protein
MMPTKRNRATDPFAGEKNGMRSGRAPLSAFVPYPKNARIHPEREIELLARILLLRGFDQPIVVDEDFIILKGHGRLDAAKRAGLSAAPYVQRLGLEEDEKKAIRLEDNQMPLLAGWNLELLRPELTELKLAGYEMQMLGFENASIEWLTTGDLVLDPKGEWQGMPGFNHEDKTAFRTLIVHFKDQAAVDRFAKAIKQKITAQTRSLWYPPEPIEKYVDKRYAAAAE